VPGYIKANFEKAWNKFDINADGFIKAEETHTFMRSLMGKLNKFALAPGSLSDISSGTDTMAQVTTSAEAEVAKPPVKKAAPAPVKKPVAEKAAAEEENMNDLEAEAMKQLEAQLAGAEAQEDASLIDIGQDE